MDPLALGKAHKEFQRLTGWDAGIMIWQLMSDKEQNWSFSENYDKGYREG